MNDEIDEPGWEAGARRHEQALTLFEAGRLAEAEPVAEAAMLALLAALPGGHPDAANAADTLARIVEQRGRPTQAVELWRRALTILEDYKDDRLAGRMRLGVLGRLGHTLTLLGEYAAARQHIEETIREAQCLFGEQSAAMVNGYNLLGMHHKLQGHLDEAEAAYSRARELCEKNGRKPSADLLHNLAGLACERHDGVRAEQLAHQAISRRKETSGETAFELGMDLAGLGDALYLQGRFDESAASYRKALSIYEGVGRGDHPEVAYALHNLADALVAAGQRAEAERCYRDSIARKEIAFGAESHEVAASLNNLAALLGEMRRFEDAISYSDRACSIAARLHADHPIRVGCEKLAAEIRRAKEIAPR